MRRTFPVLNNASCCRCICLLLYVHTTVFSAVLTHASSHTNIAARALTRTCVAELLYSPVRPLVDVKVFQVLQRAINNTSKAGHNVSVTPIDPSETSRVFTDDLR